ncbi:MAG: hypothetical protein BIP78_1359 [Candidatus Bipolaricaulis sibiricus]|uniref:HEAT repeat domain-containing protein n=1 Tax=Bipolaricaulis sibiricus TaxID=2501609 RepID=A0A410FVI7_BIPS1|nr:MAG: hypothetical protein BIP78_1359 [Candidatus Bipolaricaulis sibiricus]
MTQEQVLEAWRRGGASRTRVLIALSEDGALDWVDRLLPGPPEARRLAAALLGRSPHLAEALGHLRTLVSDDDRYTREAAVQAVVQLWHERFEEAYPILGAWRTDPNPLVRRAVVLAAGGIAEPLRLDRVAPLFSLLDPFVRDRAPEVRAAVEGVLAHALFTAYPEDTFEQLTYWSASHDTGVLSHVATALGQAPATIGRRALIVLRRVALADGRPVRAAVVRAMANLAPACPDAVGTELRRWLSDPERAAIAREALGRIDGEFLSAKRPPACPRPVA